MSARSSLLAFAVAAAIGLLLLLLAGASDARSTAFSLDVPDVGPVATLGQGHEACEGPIVTTDPFAGLYTWAVAAPGPGAALDVTIRGVAEAQTIARGRFVASSVAPTAYLIALNATVPAGLRVTVCVRNDGPSPVALLGSGPASGSNGLALDGKPVPLEFSLVFERSEPRSLLSLVPTIFDRAELFRPGWVGAWTFWGLTLALLAAVGFAGVAVARAAREDELDEDGASTGEDRDASRSDRRR